jgi:hypothetical protein
MNTPKLSRAGKIAIMALFAVLVLGQAAIQAGPRTQPREVVTYVPAATVVFAADAWYVKAFDRLVQGLNNRKSMIQFGLIVMLIGLWIIWWRR